jgi:hypothetical protein
MARSASTLLTCMIAWFHSVLGDAIHFVLCGLRNCKLTDIACQDMQHGNKHGPAAAVTVTLTFELPPADLNAGGQAPCSLSFTRTCASASSRGSVTLVNAHGQMQQLSEVLGSQPFCDCSHRMQLQMFVTTMHACSMCAFAGMQIQLQDRLLDIGIDTCQVDRSQISAALHC